MVKKKNKVIIFALTIALLHHFIGHWLIQNYFIKQLEWGAEFFSSLPAIFLGSTFAVTVYIFLIVWFFGKRFEKGRKMFFN